MSKEKVIELAMQDLEEGCSKQSNSKWKGPEIEACLARLRKSEEAAMYLLCFFLYHILPLSVSKISRDQEVFMFQEQKKTYIFGKQ